ncbi:hypothetical protein A2W24_03185 [Microgenomates group bacterium RBG_16_45_19]|nr:MAG: hypothetical protein A2W24_03185 [Microgenomates group bacterium RBG_16_45_19]
MLAENRRPDLMTAAGYYLSSMVTLATKIKGFRWHAKGDHWVKLRNGLSFYWQKPMDLWEIKEVAIDRQYEAVKSLKGGEVVIDIGAGIGDFALTAARAGATVLAFDKDNNRVNRLKKNIKTNQLTGIKVWVQEVKSLDELMTSHRIRRCDFLKVDCEGAEYPIFKQSSTRSLQRVKHMAMEAHLFTGKMEEDFDRLVARLRKLGFDCQVFNNEVHRQLKMVFATNR